MKLFLIAALLAAAAAAPSNTYTKYAPEITIVSQSDVRNVDGSSKWSYAGSDGTTREEANIQKKVNYESGNANQGSSYYISPEGQRITLTWVADENGFQPKGDHLPTPPPIPKEIADILPLLPKLQEPVYEAQTYKKY